MSDLIPCECGKGHIMQNEHGHTTCSDTLAKYELQHGKKYPGAWLPSKRQEITETEQINMSDSKAILEETDIQLLDGSFIPNYATLCSECSTMALVLLDGCQTCLSCGWSKCG